MMGSAAVAAVTDFFNKDSRFKQRPKYNQRTGEKEPDPEDLTHEQKVALFVKNAFTEPDIPFIWKDYQEFADKPPVSVLQTLIIYVFTSIKEKHGGYRSEIVLKTFAVHFGSKGINIPPGDALKRAIDTKKYPVGAMALALTAVCICRFNLVYYSLII